MQPDGGRSLSVVQTERSEENADGRGDATAEERTREQLNTGTKDVAESHRFDEAALDRWMQANVEGYAGPLEVRQFKGGQSNPTYQLITPAKKYVMRRKPPGKLLPSAHAVDREYRVITALYPTGFPVAKHLWPVHGRRASSAPCSTSWTWSRAASSGTRRLPSYSRPSAAPIYMAQLKTLADLHNTDYAGHRPRGLRPPRQLHGPPDRPLDQAVQGLRDRAASTPIERLIEWLPRTCPEDDQTSIVHGDYRLDNMIMHPTEPRVIAVLDWELSTIGNPLADFTYLLMQLGQRRRSRRSPTRRRTASRRSRRWWTNIAA